MDLRGAVALVTGGSSGIGRAIARDLAVRGARVTINGRNGERLRQVAEALGVAAVQGDVGREEDAARAVGEVVARAGRLDVLVNNAGWGTFAPLVDMELEALEGMYRTNVFGAFLMAREAARHFIARGGGGHIVNVASTAALKGFAGGSGYAATKAALRSMSESWRDELRRHDVRVIQVNPSEVVTDFYPRAGLDQKASDKKLRPEEISHAVVGALEMDDRGFVPELTVFATNPF